MIRRPLPVVVAVAAVLTALIGCTPTPSPTPKASTVSAQDAHDEMDALLDRTQAIFGGRWEPLDTNAEPCPDGHPGVIFAFGRIGPGSDAADIATRVREVVALWRRTGFDGTVTHSTRDGVALTEVRYPAGGYAVDGRYLSLVASAHGTTIDAQSPCVPGDSDAYNGKHPGSDATPAP